jgi:hypothetical protein
MLRLKYIIHFFYLLLTCFAIIVGMYFFQSNLDIEVKAEEPNSLYVRVSKNYVKPGEGYYLYVFDRKMPLSRYSGQLDVQTPDYTGLWKDFSGNPIHVDNGIAVVIIPGYINPFEVESVKFRPNPNPNNFGWSNEISQGVGSASNLDSLADYYIMPNEDILFEGINSTFASPINFSAVVGYFDSGYSCTPGKVYYLIKDRPEGYWDPRTPWQDAQKGSGYDELNHLRYITNIDMSQQTGWHDGYLHAYGNERFDYNPIEPWTRSNNFNTKVGQTRYDSKDLQYPPYLLGPKYFSLGWGVLNKRSSYNEDSSSTQFCSLPTADTTESLWFVHLDKTSISGYNDVIRIKYYEGPNSFSEDSSLHGSREDWYFARGIGLVRIDVHYFCPNSWGFSNCKPCPEEDDCILNEYIQTPHVTLSRVGKYSTITPTPSPTVTSTPTPTTSLIPGDANGDDTVDVADYAIWITQYLNYSPQPNKDPDFNNDNQIDGKDFVIWLNNY